MNVELAVTLLTPERIPLEIFGKGASHGVATLLDQAGIKLIHAPDCDVPRNGQIVIARARSTHRRLSGEHRPRELQVDRIVAAPELVGPQVQGIPSGLNGFIPVDPHCKVRRPLHKKPVCSASTSLRTDALR